MYCVCPSSFTEKLAHLLWLRAARDSGSPRGVGFLHGRDTRRFQFAVGFLILVFFSPRLAFAVDIYSSTDANGGMRWSTQNWDESYRKVIVATVTPSAVPTASPTATSRNAQLVRLEQRRRSLYPLVDSTAQRYGVDTNIIMALIEVESGFNTQAVSPKGARGLMQLMPATAARYGMRHVRELNDPARNLDIGIAHLKDLLAANDGQWALALASYNAGHGAIVKHGFRIPRYTETMLYVPAVLAKAIRPAAEDTPIFPSTTND